MHADDIVMYYGYMLGLLHLYESYKTNSISMPGPAFFFLVQAIYKIYMQHTH